MMQAHLQLSTASLTKKIIFCNFSVKKTQESLTMETHNCFCPVAQMILMGEALEVFSKLAESELEGFCRDKHRAMPLLGQKFNTKGNPLRMQTTRSRRTHASNA